MASIKACIFDLDGVIVDTAKYHYLAWRRLSHELGFDFTEEQNERLKGVSRMRSLDILCEMGGVVIDDERERIRLTDKKNAWYVDYITKMTPDEILPGTVDFLNACKKAGLKIAIGSASKNTPTILNQIHLAGFFDAVIDGNTVSKAKPDPEVFLKGAEAMDVKSQECVVFEDAQAGIEAAKRAGMIAIGVGSPQSLSEANKVISSLAGITIEELQQITP
jgi:beta-phosphoglucomutase